MSIYYCLICKFPKGPIFVLSVHQRITGGLAPLNEMPYYKSIRFTYLPTYFTYLHPCAVLLTSYHSIRSVAPPVTPRPYSYPFTIL